jgi:hypothetical protein
VNAQVAGVIMSFCALQAPCGGWARPPSCVGRGFIGELYRRNVNVSGDAVLVSSP